MDQGSRRILGMSFDSRLDASLCLAALRQALGARPQQRQRLIHHSDQGYQYASSSYRQLLHQKQIHQSMSRKANCYDNAHMESFWGTLKAELLAGRTFSTRAEARLAIFEYVEVFYNRTRLSTSVTALRRNSSSYWRLVRFVFGSLILIAGCSSLPNLTRFGHEGKNLHFCNLQV